MTELKRCPFCGGEAIIDREDIFCDNCFLSMRIDSRVINGEAKTYEEARKQTIESWNTRKPMDRIVERLEEEIEVFMSDIGECTFTVAYRNAIEIVKEEGK